MHAESGRLAQATITVAIYLGIIGVETYTGFGVPRAAGCEVRNTIDSVLTRATTR